MCADRSNVTLASRRFAMTTRLTLFLFSALLAGTAGAAAGDKTDVVRDLAGRVGPIVGSASACRDIARPRIQTIVDKFTAVIVEASSNEAERSDLTQSFDRSVADGRGAVTTGRTDCRSADRQLTDLERSIAGPGPVPGPNVPAIAPSSAAAPTSPTTPVAQVAPGSPVRGVTDQEIRFGIAAPFSGSSKELGRQMKLGIDTAFNRVNDAGGVEGRMLKLIAADDGFEPTRTADAMKQLYEKDQVFGIIGNVGTPTAVVAVPYALERKMLFFGAFTGANVLCHDPPDRYVCNYRASYAEETDAVVRYLVKMRGLRPDQIAVFAQQDAYGDSGFAGVAKAMRTLRGGNEGAILRLDYQRNTLDVDDAVARLRAHKIPIKAIGMVPTYRAAAKFIEKTREVYPAMIYTNVSFVGSTALADELMLLGPRYANGVIVTQVVPAVDSYASTVLKYKTALAKYFPGVPPDYVSLEGYVAGSLLLEGLKRAGRQLDTEKLVEALETVRNFDMGLGALISFG